MAFTMDDSLQALHHDLPYRPQSVYAKRQPIRPHLKRGSPLSNGYTTDHERRNSFDSSEDEAPVPKLSAAAEELLGVGTGERPSAQANNRNVNHLHYNNGSPITKDTYAAQRMLPRTQHTQSPVGNNSPSPRVVKISGGRPPSRSLRRAVSVAGIHNGSPLGTGKHSDMKTPASKAESFVEDFSRSPHGIGNYSGKALSSGSELAGATTRFGSKTEESAIQSSIRIKRLSKMSGSFLSGPARRGMIRRQSEEEYVPYAGTDDPLEEEENIKRTFRPSRQSIDHLLPSSPLGEATRAKQKVQFVETPILHNHKSEQPYSPEELGRSPFLHQNMEQPISEQQFPLNSSFKTTAPEPKPLPTYHIPAQRDQENVPPPSSKHDKAVQEAMSLAKQTRLADAVKDIHLDASPQRKPLIAKSNNTPLRPPPPPPKMSVLETATAAATANAKKKPRNMISVNGKHFTRMECIGRGGSGRVYRVMAENFKLFAVKSVSLEGLDELTIRGFKGEIELLKELQDVDRVVRLYDYEINEEKKVLRVLMDIGELDLRKILSPKLDEETGRFDITFTRYIWKEMLECVAAVHAFDIVHSDLKPDNFIMMQGRLKLIDFGIANAIQDDTVNVHREQQVGTPNYMSPETLVDTNVQNGKRPAGVGKLMKVGKPSDVWSLGCILYQIVYGKPPFGTITNTVRKVMAITDKSHIIPYPPMGIGGIPVPIGLIRTLKKCLDRDASRRPTIEQLLGMQDLFLHPDAPGTVPINVELLGRLQNNIIQHVIAHGVPTPAELEMWPRRFFESIRAALEESRA